MRDKKLSDELVKYGYVFSVSKMVITYSLMVVMTIVVGLFFHLSFGFIVALIVAVALMLPLYIKNYNYFIGTIDKSINFFDQKQIFKKVRMNQSFLYSLLHLRLNQFKHLHKFIIGYYLPLQLKSFIHPN